MTIHCTLDQLVALREAVAPSEPGHAAAREHLATCAECRAEADRLEQRVARLKALPVLRPVRDRFAEIEARVSAERRARRTRWTVFTGLATAASFVGALMVGNKYLAEPADQGQQLAEVMAESRLLEGELARLDPENRAMDLVTAEVAGQLTSRIAALDEQLQTNAAVTQVRPTEDQLIQLWRERVGLMDALMDVHLTGARQVGL